MIAAALFALTLAVADEMAALAARLDAARSTYQRIFEAHPREHTILDGLAIPQRIADDRELLDETVPDGYDRADWSETVRLLVDLDADLVEQLANRPAPFDLEPGLREHILRSGRDGVFDAVATYVPSGPPRAVAIVLHGNPQTESGLLAQPYLRRLADLTATILIAPYGRGSYDFRGPPTADLYGLVDLLKASPKVSSLRFFLAGYSMGGFTAYMLGPGAPIRWDGVLDVSGALVGSAAGAVVKRWSNTRIYVVHGERDTSIPTQFSHDTAIFLFEAGIPVSYYEQPSGGHALRTLFPQLRQAWLDMHAGTVRSAEAGRLAREGMRALPSGAGPAAGHVDHP
ncbi:MAG: hypothetical protein JO359_14495 [Candidatus Eremiobacteraeota bacterium]|nr:hypothetical protein [Candidatus Eremiobacteraeota bacterium]